MAVSSATENELKITVTKQINASPQRVFDAWLDPKLLCKWIGPRQWVESCEASLFEPRVGGRYELRTRIKPMPGRDACKGGVVSGVYRKIDRHTLLSFTWIRDGEDIETLVTVQFEPSGAGTRLTLTHEGFTSEQARDQHLAGWTGSMAQLDEMLELRLTLRQQVNAPPQRVFDALLDPKLICQWMGPRMMVESCEVMSLEPRVGGRYRLKMHRRPDAPGGSDPLVVTGTYQEIDPPRRLVYSWTWEHEMQESRVAWQLHPHAGGTEVILVHDGFASIERMQSHQLGWTASMQQLAEVLQRASNHE